MLLTDLNCDNLANLHKPRWPPLNFRKNQEISFLPYYNCLFYNFSKLKARKHDFSDKKAMPKENL